MEKKATLRHTFQRYIQGQLNEQETRDFLLHVQSGRDHELLQELIRKTMVDPVDQTALQHPELLSLLDKTWNSLQLKLQKNKRKPVLSWKRISTVAAITIGVLLCGFWLFFRNNNAVRQQATQEVILPGKQTATLTLANGEQIRLQYAENGQIAEEADVRISKSADGQLIYEQKDNGGSPTGTNTLSTAKGETYKVRLPDGTQVWLNAASSISYPAHFSGQDKREIKLDGEAYFEVAIDRKRPFIVHTVHQQVEVLGTHFNINSYHDEPMVRTTLFEGAVQVRSQDQKLQLQPGQQSTLTSTGTLQVDQVDTAPIIAWTQNEFMFDGDDIESVMRKIARWYNVDVVYQGKKTSERFGGGLSRFNDVQQALNLLEKTGTVHFKIEKRTIYVRP